MTVVSLHPDVKLSVTKQQFLDAVADHFDQFTSQFQDEPNTIVFGFGNDKGDASCRWHITDKEPGNMCMMLIVNVAYQIKRTVDAN